MLLASRPAGPVRREQVLHCKTIFQGLDWLRFFLAAYLVIFHTLRNYSEVKQSALLYGFFGIGNFVTSCFFLLSGFILTHVYIGSSGGRDIQKRAFFITRFSALYPLHIIALLLALSAIISLKYELGSLALKIHPVLASDFRVLQGPEVLMNIASHLTLTHAWNPLYMCFNGPSWSISALFFFYLMFPFVAPRIYQSRKPFIGLLVTGCLFAAPGIVATILNLHDPLTDGLLHRNPIIRLPLFLAGIYLYVCFKRRREYKGTKMRNAWLLALILASCFCGAYFQGQTQLGRFHWIDNGLYFIASLATIWLLCDMRRSNNSWGLIWSSRLGKASLSIFVLHVPLHQLLVKIERVVVGLAYAVQSGSGLSDFMKAALNHEKSWMFYPLHFLFIIFFSIFVHKQIVEPIQAAVRRKLIARSVPKPSETFVDAGLA